MQRERLGPRDIPCHVIDDETDAAEISLAENVQREAMHPADEFALCGRLQAM
jgi:ParB-like chromosome segregation protein Spo0J